MDKTTHAVRLTEWKNIINNCLARPQGQTAKQWLAENGISDKQYYYWLRRIRQETYQAATVNGDLPAVAGQADVVLAEITGISEIPEGTPCTELDFHADAVVKVKDLHIALSNSASAVLIGRIIKAVSHAL